MSAGPSGHAWSLIFLLKHGLIFLPALPPRLPLPTSNLPDPHLRSFTSAQYTHLQNQKPNEITRSTDFLSLSLGVRYVQLNHNGTQAHLCCLGWCLCPTERLN